MSQILARPLRLVVPAFFLGAALMPAAASAQVLIYEGPYGPPPGYYGGRPPVPRYPILAPREVMNIVREMGYWRVSVPRLAGGTYVVTAADEEGPVVLRINAATGQVLSARGINGGPTIAVPSGPPPHREASPGAPPRSAPPPVARLAPAPSPSAPLPPPRPPEASVAAVTPAPNDVPAPNAAPAAPLSPQATAPANVAPSVPTPSGAAAPATSAAPANPSPPPAAPAPTPPKPQEAQANPAAQAPQGPVSRKAGTGTGTPGASSAGTASVLSKPKAAN